MQLPDADETYIREVFARFGLAMYWAQALEREVAILLAGVYNPTFARSTVSERQRNFDDHYSKTLGQLASKLRTVTEVPSQLEAELLESVKTRNWLAHDYFWDRAGYFHSPEGRTAILDELTALGERIKTVYDALSPISEKWFRQSGIPQEIVETELDELIREGRQAGGGA